MTDIFLGIGSAALIVYVIVFSVFVRNLMRTSRALEESVRRTEGNANATLIELKGTLENIRKITGDVGVVTEEVRQISHTVAGLEKSIRELYGYFRGELGTAAEANLAGLKAGIKTGVVTLVKNLREKEGST